MKYHTYSFEKLEVYQLARNIKKDIKLLTNQLPLEEKFDLISQLNRSTSSIATNLAEGSGRASNLDQAHFTNISYSSALETIHHLNTALDLNYIDENIYSELRVKLDTIINKLNALYKFQINNKEVLKKRV